MVDFNSRFLLETAEPAFGFETNKPIEVQTQYGAWENELVPFLHKNSVFHLCSTYKPKFALRADAIASVQFQFQYNIAENYNLSQEYVSP